MSVFRPREIARRASLWHDKDGRPWLVALDFTMIAGRLQCVGMEIRSFLRDEVDISDEGYPEGFPTVYPAYWEGEANSTHPEVPTDNEFALLPVHGFSSAEIDAPDLLAMSRPGSLQSTVLRQLPLADVRTRMRQQGGSWADGIPPLAAFESGFALDDWLEERAAAWTPKKRRGGRVAKYSRSDLEPVAAIYSTVYELGSTSPTKDVAERLGITRNQAAKLVMKCRAVGLLGPVQGRTAGGILPEPQTHNELRQHPTRRRSDDDEGGSDDDTT